jgi:hypothetical protein
MLYGRAVSFGIGWISIVLIAAAGLVSIYLYFCYPASLPGEPVREPRALLTPFEPLERRELALRALSTLTTKTYFSHGFVHSCERAVVTSPRQTDLSLHSASFERLCNLVISELAWHAQYERHFEEALDRITRQPEAELELVIISRATTGTISFKIRPYSSSRGKPSRAERHPLPGQVFDWVDSTSTTAN